MSTELTDDQARELKHAAAAAWGGHSLADALRDKGWTIEPPPKPRYQTLYEAGFWKVYERGKRYWAVNFDANSHPDAEAAAQAEADRLNGGAA